MKMKHFCILFLAAFLIFFLGACGSSDNDSDGTVTDNDDTEETSYSLSGLAVKGLISGGTVEVYSLDDDGDKDELLGTAATDGDGNYSIDIGDYTGPVVVEVTGGTYVDEATGDTVDLDGTLRAALPSVSGDVDVAVTPLTEIAVSLAEAGGGLSADKIEDANDLLSQLIDADITETLPADVGDADDFGAASEAEQNYALMLAAISQMSETSGTDVMDVIEEIEEDISDLTLDETGAELAAAIGDFIASDENASGAEEAGALEELVDNAIEGLEPTGDLSEAKILLAAFMVDPSDDNYDSLATYLETFTPASEEAYLFSAIAELMDIYESDAVDFLTDNGVTLDAFALQDADGDGVIDEDEEFDFNAVLAALLELSTLETDITALFAGLESRLDDVYDTLALAEGVSTFISLTGFDTIYLDDIDVKSLKGIASGFKAACILLQAVDFGVDNWLVDSGATNVKTVITSDGELTDDQLEEFLGNNPDLFTWGDSTKIDEFKTAFTQFAADYATQLAALEAVSDEGGLDSRIENAFNIGTEFQLRMSKTWTDTLAAVLDAFDDATASIPYGDEKFSSGSVVYNAADGYSYFTVYYNIYMVPLAPVDTSGVTLYSLLNGTYSPIDLITMESSPYSDGDGTGTPVEGGPFEYVEWDDPIKSTTIPEADIAIDGDASDWDSVPVFKTSGNFSYKIAADYDSDTFSMFVSNATIGSELNAENEYSVFLVISVWPWYQEEGVAPPEGYYYTTSSLVGFENISGNIIAFTNGVGIDEAPGPGAPPAGDDLLVGYEGILSTSLAVVGIEAKFNGLDQLMGDGFINPVVTEGYLDEANWHQETLMKFIP